MTSQSKFLKIQNFNCSSFQFICVNDGMGFIPTMCIKYQNTMWKI
jgi:hypothetical protein